MTVWRGDFLYCPGLCPGRAASRPWTTARRFSGSAQPACTRYTPFGFLYPARLRNRPRHVACRKAPSPLPHCLAVPRPTECSPTDVPAPPCPADTPTSPHMPNAGGTAQGCPCVPRCRAGRSRRQPFSPFGDAPRLLLRRPPAGASRANKKTVPPPQGQDRCQQNRENSLTIWPALPAWPERFAVLRWWE